MSLLEIKNLRVWFNRFMPVKGASLTIEKGELVALIGGSGSGKSTLAMSILRLQDEAKLEGEILFNGKNILEFSEGKMIKTRGSKIAMIFQEPMSSLNPLQTVGQQITEVLRLNGKPTHQRHGMNLLREAEVKDAPRIFRSYPHELSGGERQRAMIAMALAGNPDLLIADEPTTALDVTIQAQIIDLLKRLQEKRGLSILFITHDLDIVKHIADRVYVMKYGQIVSNRLPMIKRDVRHVKVYKKKIKPLVEVKKMAVYYGKRLALQHATFHVMPGQTFAVVGESGSGKSSLGQAMARLIDATGSVMIDGVDFKALSGKELRQARPKIQMVLQDPASSLNPRMTVADIIGEELRIQGEKFITAKVRHILETVSLSPMIMDRYPHELSGGQRARVALARALVLKPKVLILDEVMASLDIYTQRQMIFLLRHLQEQTDMAYVFISHDMKVVRSMADFIMVLKKGQIVERGMANFVFENPQHPYTKQLIESSFLD